MILLTPIATIVPTATTVTAMTIAVAIFPFLSSSHVSTPFINLLKTDRPIYCAATAKINANINCTNPSAMPTIPIVLNSPRIPGPIIMATERKMNYEVFLSVTVGR